MKKLFLVSLTALMLVSCGGETSSSSRFVPPPDPSSSAPGASSSYAGSLPIESAEERADKIIAEQSSLAESYTDYKMNLIRVDDSTSTSDYVYSSMHSFYAAKGTDTQTYLVTVNEVETLITVRDGQTSTFTDAAIIAASTAAFSLINRIKDLALNVLEGAFASTNDATVLDASIDENDNFRITIDTGTFLSSFYAVVDMTFSSSSLPTDLTMKINEGSYAGNHITASFTYGTTEADRVYPAI